MNDVSSRVSRPHIPQSPLTPHGAIQNVIAVGSGKGGVGKSTTALNLAFSLVKAGYQVGLLDADVQGPSVAKLTGLEDRRIEKPPADSQQANLALQPISIFGLKTLSFAYLLPKTDQPIIWRGPMVSSALSQLFFQADWGYLDFLVIDLPPGTGDILLTLVQKIPVTAAVLVTTPQEVALLDVIKTYRMFEKFGVFHAGMVINMSEYQCPACGHTEKLFGQGAAERMAEALELPVLAHLPLSTTLTQDCDQGTPLVLSTDLATASIRSIYQTMTDQLLARVSKRPISYASRFPKIVVKS